MGLVHDDGTVLVQVRLAEGLTQQDAICHVLDDGRLRDGGGCCGRAECKWRELRKQKSALCVGK